MNALMLKKNIYWVGAMNPELRVFDIIMNTKRGTTYNAYLIKDDKIAVVDSVKDGFDSVQLNNIKSIIGDKKVDYIVVQHTELDHSGSIKMLLKEYPEAEIVASKAAIIYLKNILNRPFKSREAKEDLILGNRTLKFISAPNLHWPDTMFTYIPEDKMLFTCDFLGCHYCPIECVTDSCAGDYDEEMKYYFDVIMGPFKKFVLMGLSKIKDLDFDMIAPSHGPVHIEDIDKYLGYYKQWASEELPKEDIVEVFYISAYGNTEAIAKYMTEQINNKGIKAYCHEITSMKLEDAVALIGKAKGILIGSPTINQDAVKPAWDLLSLICPITNRGKAAGAFGSYGWSGEGVAMMTERLKSLKFKVVEPGYRVNFVPSEEDYKNAETFVDDFLKLFK